MKMKTAKEERDEAIWYILNEIEKSARLSALADTSIIPYTVLTTEEHQDYGMLIQIEALNYLAEHKIILFKEKPTELNLEDEFTHETIRSGLSYLIEKTTAYDDFFRDYENKYTSVDTERKFIINKITGEIIYITLGSHYKAIFKPTDNSMRLLLHLSKNPKKTSNCSELYKIIENVDEVPSRIDAERKVRDAVQYIRKKLKVDKVKELDPFIVSDKHFGLNCNIEIRS
jgi:hypothetical protein